MKPNPWLADFLADPGPIGANGAIGMAEIARDGPPGPVPPEWLEGMARLTEAEPPPGIAPTLWRSRMRAAQAFVRTWGAKAHACGWSTAELFALHPSAPLNRFDTMGAAFLSGGRAVAVTAEAVMVRTESGTIQRTHRRPNSYPPAWETFA